MSDLSRGFFASRPAGRANRLNLYTFNYVVAVVRSVNNMCRSKFSILLSQLYQALIIRSMDITIAATFAARGASCRKNERQIRQGWRI